MSYRDFPLPAGERGLAKCVFLEFGSKKFQRRPGEVLFFVQFVTWTHLVYFCLSGSLNLKCTLFNHFHFFSFYIPISLYRLVSYDQEVPSAFQGM